MCILSSSQSGLLTIPSPPYPHYTRHSPSSTLSRHPGPLPMMPSSAHPIAGRPEEDRCGRLNAPPKRGALLLVTEVSEAQQHHRLPFPDNVSNTSVAFHPFSRAISSDYRYLQSSFVPPSPRSPQCITSAQPSKANRFRPYQITKNRQHGQRGRRLPGQACRAGRAL